MSRTDLTAPGSLEGPHVSGHASFGAARISASAVFLRHALAPTLCCSAATMDSPPLEVRVACGASDDDGVLLMPGVHEPSDLMREAEEAADACLLLRGAAEEAEQSGLVGKLQGCWGVQ